MAILPIRIYPDPILRVECAPVETFNAELAQLADDMVETMYNAPGVGLAAPQVGIDRRLMVVDVTVGEEEDTLFVFVNPQILESSGAEVDVEGCLSIPDLTEKVERPQRLTLRAQDLVGDTFELEAEDFFARAICHEIDHLNGVLFVDHLAGLKRDRARRKLRRLVRAGQQEASP